MMKPIPIIGGMLLHPTRIALGVAILVLYSILGQEFLVLKAKPMLLLVLLIASFCLYYSIESDPKDDEGLEGMKEVDRKRIALDRLKKSKKIGVVLLLVSLVAGYFLWPSLMRWLSV